MQPQCARVGARQRLFVLDEQDMAGLALPAADDLVLRWRASSTSGVKLSGPEPDGTDSAGAV